MKRPSYKAAIQFIAFNDEDACTDFESVYHQVTVVMVSELFDVAQEIVAQEVLNLREARTRAERLLSDNAEGYFIPAMGGLYKIGGA